MLKDWEIVEYREQIMVLIQGDEIYGELVREAFPDVPSTDNFADASGEYSFVFSMLSLPNVAERVGYLLKALSGTLLLPSHLFTRGFALDWYSIPGQRPRKRTELGHLLFEYKHQTRYGNIEQLAVHVSRFIKHHPLYLTADFIVPIPVNDISRPFDLVARLAELAGTMVSIPVLGNLLQKTRASVSQRTLVDIKAKRDNVQGLYSCLNSNLIKGRSIILFDDIFDTGASMVDAVRALRDAGARQVYALTVTRTSRGMSLDTGLDMEM